MYNLLALSLLLLQASRFRSCHRSPGFAGFVEKN